MESILTSIKKLVGITEEYPHFDADLIMHINTAFMSLRQLGVGPKTGFLITSDESTWTEFLGKNNADLEAVKSYVYLRVRILFDPPANSAVLEAMKQQIQELEWRLNIEVENEVM